MSTAYRRRLAARGAGLFRRGNRVCRGSAGLLRFGHRPDRRALKATLHEIVNGHTVVPYKSTGTDTWDALKTLDEDPGDADRVVLTYSGFTARKSDQSNGTNGTWNREHLWPQSFGLTALNSNSRAFSLFNLRPVRTTVNSSRGDKFFGVSQR